MFIRYQLAVLRLILLFLCVLIIVFLIVGIVAGYVDAAIPAVDTDVKLLSAMQKSVAMLVIEYSNKFNVDSSIVLGICWVESRLGLYDSGDDGRSLGVMQIRLGTLKYVDKLYKLGLTQKYSDVELRNMLKFNRRLNVLIGVLYLKWLLKRTGDYRLAIDGYNKGLGGIKGFDTVYVKKVLSSSEVLKKIRKQWKVERIKEWGLNGKDPLYN